MLENKKGLQWTELVARTRLNKDTVSRRLDILEQQSKIIRKPLRKHGHHIRYYIPWAKYEHAYYEVHKKPSPWILRIQDEVNKLPLSFGGELKGSKITPDLKIHLQVSAPDSVLRWPLQFDIFIREYPWIGDLPVSLPKFRSWLQGMLCHECLKVKKDFPRTIIAHVETGEYVCPDCGMTYPELTQPVPILRLREAILDLRDKNVLHVDGSDLMRSLYPER